jgi:hypothetical protein
VMQFVRDRSPEVWLPNAAASRPHCARLHAPHRSMGPRWPSVGLPLPAVCCLVAPLLFRFEVFAAGTQPCTSTFSPPVRACWT